MLGDIPAVVGIAGIHINIFPDDWITKNWNGENCLLLIWSSRSGRRLGWNWLCKSKIY